MEKKRGLLLLLSLISNSSSKIEVVGVDVVAALVTGVGWNDDGSLHCVCM